MFRSKILEKWSLFCIIRYMKIIAIVGTNGSGKGTVVEVLKKKIDLHHFSARDMIIDLAKKDGVDITNRDGLRTYNEKRNTEGKTLIQEIKKSIDAGEVKEEVCIFESLRRVSEVEELKSAFGTNFMLLAVDAPIELRYQRNNSRGSLSDNVSFEKFIEQERLESINENPFLMNIPKCVSMADVKILNVGSLEDLEKEIDEKLISRL